MRDTAAVVERFNRAFVERDAGLLVDLVGEGCVMEAVSPAPDGERVVGREECLRWWGVLIEDPAVRFTPEDVQVAGERATIRWHYAFDGGSMRGVNLMLVRDGLIVEALGYGKVPA
ncbi:MULTISPECIES: nuclear transport factor 2 family protein [unclassified Saccharothrix]|uniref:nuclear transport factor 2 family protein n=1 Tax=unclassified Saccharothrix TaxID=2593673 RepID=UPI00307FCAD1